MAFQVSGEIIGYSFNGAGQLAFHTGKTHVIGILSHAIHRKWIFVSRKSFHLENGTILPNGLNYQSGILNQDKRNYL